MARKIFLILFLYYAVGTCASQGAGAGAGSRRTAPAALRHARVVACPGGGAR